LLEARCTDLGQFLAQIGGDGCVHG
jgi:hypothetical protein